MNKTETLGTSYEPYKKYQTNSLKMYQPNKQVTKFKNKQRFKVGKYEYEPEGQI